MEKSRSDDLPGSSERPKGPDKLGYLISLQGYSFRENDYLVAEPDPVSLTAEYESQAGNDVCLS